MALSRDEATVIQGSTPTWRAQLEKSLLIGTQITHRPLLLDDISTVVLNYTNDADDTYINSRQNQNVKNANNVTITPCGHISWDLQAGDTTIVDTDLDSGDIEAHTAMFCITTTDSRIIYKSVQVFVKKR